MPHAFLKNVYKVLLSQELKIGNKENQNQKGRENKIIKRW